MSVANKIGKLFEANEGRRQGWPLEVWVPQCNAYSPFRYLPILRMPGTLHTHGCTNLVNAAKAGAKLARHEQTAIDLLRAGF